MSYIWITGIIISFCVLLYRVLSAHGKDIFCPFYLVSLLYVIIFVYGPSYYLKRGLTRVEGIETISYISEATWVFLAGYFIYFIGSIIGSRLLSRNQMRKVHLQDCANGAFNKTKVHYIVRYAWTVYFFGIALGIIYYLTIGRSLAMMLSFGQLGERVYLSTSGSLAFLVYFMDFPIGALLLLHTFSNKKTLVWIATAAYAIMTTSAGFRYLPMCFGLAAVANHYISNDKRPKMIMTIAAIVVAYVFVGVVGIFRGAMRTGGEIDWSGVNTDTISAAFRFNSDIFFPFYNLVHYIRNGAISPHYGKGVLYIFIFAIPRFFWSTKPTSLGKTAFEAMWGSSLGGAAYPNIGEFYYEFGFLGMLICMLMFGRIIENQFNYTLRISGNRIEVIKYSILYGYLLQFVNRGYFAGWAFDLLFFLFPVWFLEYTLKRRAWSY